MLPNVTILTYYEKMKLKKKLYVRQCMSSLAHFGTERFMLRNTDYLYYMRRAQEGALMTAFQA